MIAIVAKLVYLIRLCYKKYMNEQLRQAKRRVIFRFLMMIVIILAVPVCICMMVMHVARDNETSELVSIVPIRELLLDNATSMKADAPIDPKTGDIYFPQAKLYLPNSSSYVHMTYAYDEASDNKLSISSQAALRQSVSQMYSARNATELFTAVPYLQACQRGITVAYQETNDDTKELKQTVHLTNGKTLYLYIEKSCPILSETAEILKGLRSY